MSTSSGYTSTANGQTSTMNHQIIFANTASDMTGSAITIPCYKVLFNGRI